MLQRKDNRTSLAFVLTRAVPALLLTLAAGGLAFLLLAWAAHQSDRVSFQRQERLVALVVSQLRSQVAHDQESSTVWDTAVEKVRADDTHWIDDNLGWRRSAPTTRTGSTTISAPGCTVTSGSTAPMC